MTTFALDYAREPRVLTMRHRARSLDGGRRFHRMAAAVDCLRRRGCRASATRHSWAALDARFVGAGLQGWLRRAGAGGRVEPADLDEPPRLDVAVVSEADHPRVDDIASRLVAAGAIVAITHGACGATLVMPSGRLGVAAVPHARGREPTGAGDVFGVVLTLQLAAGATARGRRTRRRRSWPRASSKVRCSAACDDRPSRVAEQSCRSSS